VFDIMRGFLPAGITTQLSWHTNLRQAGDHLAWMQHHPSPEISSLANTMLGMLNEKYPSSGFSSHIAALSGIGTGDSGSTFERTAWEARIASKYSYLDPHSGLTWDRFENDEGVAFWFNDTLRTSIDIHREIVDTRPKGCVLPHFLSDGGQFHWTFLLDFGSWRDIQRHRNGVCRMPLLTTEYKFEPWYLDQLGLSLREEAVELLRAQESRIEEVTKDPVLRQYYTALGYRVYTDLTYSLPAAVYVMELRSGKLIHPTLRKKIHKMIESFKLRLPTFRLYVDLDPSDWDVRRGTQTITAK
jgi:hypothetical protein